MRSASETSAVNVLGLVVQNIDDEYDNLTTHREYTIELRREEMRNVSAAVVEALDHFHGLQADGSLSEEAAQDAALLYLRDLRYGNNDYFYTYDPEMLAISHPDPSVMGRDMLGIVDAKGKHIGQEIRDIALVRGEGFVSFWWKRLDTDEPSPKLGYVFHYPKWDWIIGTGVYIDDVELEAQRKAPWVVRARRFEPLDLYVVSAEPQSEIDAPGRDLLMHQALIGLGVLTFSLLLASAIVRRVTGPLATLTAYTEALPEQEFRLPDDAVAVVEDLTQRHRDEIGRLAGTFLAMERALQQYIAELRETTANRERIESELRIARDIQMGILPKTFPPFPERPELDIHAAIEPAREMGGDLYDFFFVDDDTLCFLIGDVSGKGVPAALFMAVTSTLVKAVAQGSHDPSEILAKVNDDLSQENESCMFVSLFLGMLDLRSGAVRYANAGHNPPLVMPRDARAAYLPVIGDPVAGPLQGASYTAQHLTLRPGDAMLLYTDGVTEAMNDRGEMFGTERLLEQVGRAGAGNAAQLVSSVREEVAVFTGGAQQSDDIAVLVLRVVGSGGESGWEAGEESGVAPSGSLRLPARTENLHRFRAHAAACLGRWEIPEEVIQHADLVLEEVLVNAASYAYPDGEGDVELSCALEEGLHGARLCLSLRDWGAEFDPTSTQDPDLAQGVAERQAGGVGLVLVRHMTDDLRYTRHEDGNTLTFCFDLGREGGA
jgi:serine phosphatase RsbU (regulator of sigma subunit)/anti-sigma regulatory factor (Ser/Thr protein kinase)